MKNKIKFILAPLLIIIITSFKINEVEEQYFIMGKVINIPMNCNEGKDIFTEVTAWYWQVANGPFNETFRGNYTSLENRMMNDYPKAMKYIVNTSYYDYPNARCAAIISYTIKPAHWDCQVKWIVYGLGQNDTEAYNNAVRIKQNSDGANSEHILERYVRWNGY